MDLDVGVTGNLSFLQTLKQSFHVCYTANIKFEKSNPLDRHQNVGTSILKNKMMGRYCLFCSCRALECL